jgi:hypothetical protein
MQDLAAIRIALLDRGADRLGELRCHPLVRIDRQHPLSLRQRERVVLPGPNPFQS